jgi:hypothetical protein
MMEFISVEIPYGKFQVKFNKLQMLIIIIKL